MRQCKLLKILFFCFCIVLLIGTKISALAITENDCKNILIINSYNENFPWTKDITKGINKVIKEEFKNYNILIDNMDLKTNNDEEYVKRFYDLQKSKYKGKTIDMIICSDNGALDYLLKYRDELFGKVPVIFCGVNPPYSPLASKDNLYVGVEETIDADGMLKIINDFHPQLDNLYVFYGNTTTGIISKTNIENSYKKTNYNFKCNFIADKDLNSVRERISNFNDKSAVLFAADPIKLDGSEVAYISNFNDNFFKESAIPLFSFWDFDLNYGALGGNLLSGLQQGESAGKMAIDILNGKSIKDLNTIKDEHTLVFDYNKLTQFNIPKNKIPENSIIINKPFSFYEEYKVLVVTTFIILILLIIIIIVLIVFYKEKAKSEKLINQNYEELSAVYEELAATEEELREQFDELSEAKDIIKINEERLSLALEGSNDAIFEWNMITDELFLSEAWTKMIGKTIKEKIYFTSYWKKVMLQEDFLVFRDKVENYLKNYKNIFNHKFRVKRRGNIYKWILMKGKVIKDNYGMPIKISGSITDITHRVEYENNIKHMAYYDSLTGLPNRRLIIKEVKKAISEKNKFVILFLDLDEFKNINDVLGHDYGDLLLKKISNQLINMGGYNTLISRLGGDEFVIILFNDLSEKEIEDFSLALMSIFKQPFNINNSIIYVTASVGICKYPADGEDLETLFKNVDTAMYKAKEKGKNQYCFFDPLMREEIVKNNMMENELRNAIVNNELELYYQPQVHFKDGYAVGMEALIRWNNKKLGFVFPSDFIPLAEKTGLIIPIGIRVLETACKKIRLWKSKGYRFSSIAINVSPTQIKDKDFLRSFEKVLESYKDCIKYIELEITENILLNDIKENIVKLNSLRSLGLKLALDDFGTNYSSLNYLRILPVDRVKIDKSFIDLIGTDSKQSAITEDIINLCHKLNYAIVAEGIENITQHNILKSMNCDLAQGYYYSKPLTDKDIEEFFKANRNFNN